MKENEGGLNLLLAHMDDNSPVLSEGLPPKSAGEQEPEAKRDVSGDSFYDPSASGNDLAAQGWSVIAPEGKRGDELLGRIQPLIDARAAQLSEPLKIYRVPARMSTDDAMRWRSDIYNDGDPDFIPRYQLIVGDLHEVPYELQAVQMGEGFVGRLAFKDPEGYESYVEKLLRWEKNPSPIKAPKSMFYTVHDGTAATRIGYRGLIEPVVAQAREMRDAGRYKAGEIIECGDHDDPTQDELLDAAGDLESGVLFSMSHGCGAPRKGWSSARAQLNGQGAMSFGREGCLPGRDLHDMPFVPGGIWFMFACFGAGTPERSKFHHWLAQLAKSRQYRGHPEAVLKSLPSSNQRPFIGALPQAALASPEGPLAFVGHLDLAWTYSFMEIDKGKQKKRPQKYYNILKSLCRGDRVGISMLELMRFYNDKNQELTDLYDLMAEARLAKRSSPVTPEKLGHLWMVRQDLSGYILLGDPAARLPISKGSSHESPPGPKQETITIYSTGASPSEEAGKAASFSATDHEEDGMDTEQDEGREQADQSEEFRVQEDGNDQPTSDQPGDVDVEGDVRKQTSTQGRDARIQEGGEHNAADEGGEIHRGEQAADQSGLGDGGESEISAHADKSDDSESCRNETLRGAGSVDGGVSEVPVKHITKEEVDMHIVREQKNTPAATSIPDEGHADEYESGSSEAPGNRRRRRDGEVKGEVVVHEEGSADGPIHVRWNISWKIT